MALAPWTNLAPDTADVDSRFAQLSAAEWDWRLAEFPQLATRVGEHRHDDRLECVDRASRTARLAYWRKTLAALGRISAMEMSPEARVDRAVFANQLERFIATAETQADLMPLDSQSSFYTALADLPERQPLLNGADYHRYLARLADIPRFLAEHMALLRDGLASAFVLPRVVLEGRDLPLAVLCAQTDPTRTPFYKPFLAFPAAAPAAEQASLRLQASTLIAHRVLPAYGELLDFMRHTYVPRARRTTAAGDLPDGQAFYEARIREFTSLALDAEEIHRRGVAEVERLRAELLALMGAAGLQGSFAQLQDFLRHDPQFHARSAQELIARAACVAKCVDGELPKYFGRLPRQPCALAAVPADRAPFYASGGYRPAPQPMGFAGTFWLNTHALAARPLYALPALTLHQAVPGRHLQCALASELEEQPPFRRHGHVAAYTHGWALYAEFLGQEMGLYQTPWEQIGRCASELRHACGLVVDTGLHALRWSRDDARTYLLAHTALSEHEAATEVDRCISRPGRALAFKTGELKLRELRERACARLGKRFDLRAFHDTVLALGSLPLPVLEAQIDAWIARGVAF